MNWDAQSDRAANRYYSDWCPDGIQEAHRRGARWQREALLSGEAIERAARAVYENRVAIIEDPEERRSWPAWEAHESSDADEWRAMARIALTAVIGDDR